MNSALILGEGRAAPRGRGPAFLPADLRAEAAGGLYQSLYKRLRAFILDGVWPPGTRVPSSRALAADLKVSRNTAILAVEQLIADGWVESRSRSGVYVSAAPVAPPAPARASERAAPAELPPFALQRPATDLFPAQIWKQLQARAWAEIEPHRLLTADPSGDPGLRDAIARLVCAPRGLRAHPDQILVLPSAAMAIDLIAAALLRPGDAAVLEAPGRPSVREGLRIRGARLRPVPVDAEGLDVASLPAHARLTCVAPAVQFPTGHALSPARRAYLADWARSGGGWLIEDDRDSECGAADAAPLPLAAEAPDRTIFVSSFNRQLFPGLCAAFLVAPLGVAERLRAAHAMTGGRASLASQLALRAFIGEGHLARHLRKRRQAYAERAALLAAALGGPCTQAGLHLSVPVPAGRAPEVARRLAAERLGGADLDRFSEGPATGDHILLGLGTAPDQIAALAPRLKTLIEEQL